MGTAENHPRIYMKTKEDKTAEGGETQVFTEKNSRGGGGVRSVKEILNSRRSSKARLGLG